MDLLAAWLLYPLALGLIALGHGLLLERAGGWRMPGLLLLPVGFAALVAVSRLITSEGGLAGLALPALLVLTVAGLVLGRGRLLALRPDPWMTAAVLGVFAIYAAPVVCGGAPTFAGYLALPDTGHQLSLADLFATHGPDWQSLPAGANRISMSQYVSSQYPVGGQVVLGVTAPLGIEDLAWLFQPLISVQVVMLALGLGAIASTVLAHRWQAAVVVFVAAQPSLFLGYALQGNVKEVLVAAMVVTLLALAGALAADRAPGRALLSVAVVAAAALAALGPAALAYLGVAGLALIAVWIPRRWPERRTASDAAWVAGGLVLTAVLASPILRNLQTAVDVNTATLDTGRAIEDFGNLAGPIERFQALGPYLSGDFRYHPEELETVNSIFMVIAAVLAVVGLLWLLRRRHARVLIVPTAMLGATAYLLHRGSPYADGKVLMIIAPAITFTAALGAMSMWTGRWRVLSAAACAVLAVSMVWSSALAYQDVSVAPHDRYAELLDINDELDGKGPVIFNEYDEFAKYFLRDVPSYNQPEYPHGYRGKPYMPNALADERRKPVLKSPLDIDDFTNEYLQSVPYLVLRRSPVRSAPPSNFVLQRRGRYYEVWRRTNRHRVLAHMVVGPDYLTPSAPLSEAAARRIGERAQRDGGRLAYVRREPIRGVRPALMEYSALWLPFGGYPGAIVTNKAGSVQTFVEAPGSGTYDVWTEGSFNGRPSDITLDGRRIGRLAEGLENPGAFRRVARVTMTAGVYQLRIVQGGGTLHPGSGGYRSSLRHLGPIVFQPVSDIPQRVETLPASRWRELVGERVDWVEVIR